MIGGVKYKKVLKMNRDCNLSLKHACVKDCQKKRMTKHKNAKREMKREADQFQPSPFMLP